jgi:hypothetical protein
MTASAHARALIDKRWQDTTKRNKVRGQWSGGNNPSLSLTWKQKQQVAKRLTEGRWRRNAAKQAAKLQAQMDELRAVADALWGDWRPRPPDVHG